MVRNDGLLAAQRSLCPRTPLHKEQHDQHVLTGTDLLLSA